MCFPLFSLFSISRTTVTQILTHLACSLNCVVSSPIFISVCNFLKLFFSLSFFFKVSFCSCCTDAKSTLLSEDVNNYFFLLSFFCLHGLSSKLLFPFCFSPFSITAFKKKCLVILCYLFMCKSGTLKKLLSESRTRLSR